MDTGLQGRGMGKGAVCKCVGHRCRLLGSRRLPVEQPEPRSGGQAGPVGLQPLLLENYYGFGIFSEVTLTQLPTCDEH